MLESEIRKPDTFLYFAYSVNLLRFRVKMFNPTAEFVSIARLDVCDHSSSIKLFTDNYRLDFIKHAKFWGGPQATMVPTANAHLWGVIWRLHKDDMVSLDDVKGVDIKTYFVKYVDVLTPYMGAIKCRSYMQRVYPLPRGNRDPIPAERWPSWAYKQVMILGAKENGLPRSYIRFLRKLKDNGDEGCIRTTCLLMRYGKNVPCECRVPGRIPRKPLKLDLKKIRDQKAGITEQKEVVVEKKKPKRKLQF